MSDETLQALELVLNRNFPELSIDLPANRKVMWREAGVSNSGDAIVLLHGISSGSASWLAVAKLLAANHRVLAWDAPGYGKSSPLPMQAPTDADYAQDLDDSLKALRVDRCALVGHSLGALVAAAYARQSRGASVTQLILLSPAGGYGAPGKEEQQSKVRTSRQQSLLNEGIEGLAAKIDHRLLSGAASETSRHWVRWNCGRLNPEGFLQAVELLCSSDLGASSGLLGMPIEIWVGEHDVVTPPMNCESWAQRLGARFGLIGDCGHACSIEQPQRVANVISNALSS